MPGIDRINVWLLLRDEDAVALIQLASTALVAARPLGEEAGGRLRRRTLALKSLDGPWRLSEFWQLTWEQRHHKEFCKGTAPTDAGETVRCTQDCIHEIHHVCKCPSSSSTSASSK